MDPIAGRMTHWMSAPLLLMFESELIEENELEKEIEQAKLSLNDAGGLPPAAKRLRHHQNAKQPLKLFHFPSPLMTSAAYA